MAIEVKLADAFAHQATRVSIAVNDHPLVVTCPADGCYEASLSPATLLARNRLAVVFEGATDDSILSASWIGLRLT